MPAIPIYDFDPKYTSDQDAFSFDLSAWLGDGDTIAQLPTATVTPNTATLGSIVMLDSLVTVWISGGVSGVTYFIDLAVVSSSGRNCRIRGRFKADNA